MQPEPERTALFLALAVILAGGSALAQSADPPTGDRSWVFAGSAYTYVLAGAANYVQPTIAADRGPLHLEARYNYEDLHTGSTWFGYTFSVGEKLAFTITPMVGAVFGTTDGVAPGYKGSLSWRALELSSETEYLVDAHDSSDSFLYTWSELTVTPAPWYHVGLVVQRTKAYSTEFDIERGFLVGLSLKRASVTGYVFNPDSDRPTVVVGVTLGL